MKGMMAMRSAKPCPRPCTKISGKWHGGKSRTRLCFRLCPQAFHHHSIHRLLHREVVRRGLVYRKIRNYPHYHLVHRELVHRDFVHRELPPSAILRPAPRFTKASLDEDRTMRRAEGKHGE